MRNLCIACCGRSRDVSSLTHLYVVTETPQTVNISSGSSSMPPKNPDGKKGKKQPAKKHTLCIRWPFVRQTLCIRWAFAMTNFQMGWTYMNEQLTKKQPIPNVRNVNTANAQRIHSVLINTLSPAQNFGHAQNFSHSPAYFCEPLRTANEYNVCQTCHERMTNYTNVHPNFGDKSSTLGIR